MSSCLADFLLSLPVGITRGFLGAGVHSRVGEEAVKVFIFHLQRIRGFTLIELVVTVAIVGILAAVAYPSYANAIRKARREDAMTALLELQLVQEKWRANNPSYTSTLTDLGYSVASNATSRDGYYTLNVTAASATAFTATASPKSGTAQASDSCSFTLTQNGPDISDSTKRACWSK